MKISMKWLGRYIDLDGITAEKVHDDLTMSTAEVEGLETFGGDIDDVIIGHVVERERHPDAGGAFPVSEHLSEHGLYVPSGSNLGQAEIDRVCDAIAAVHGEERAS